MNADERRQSRRRPVAVRRRTPRWRRRAPAAPRALRRRRFGLLHLAQRHDALGGQIALPLQALSARSACAGGQVVGARMSDSGLVSSSSGWPSRTRRRRRQQPRHARGDRRADLRVCPLVHGQLAEQHDPLAAGRDSTALVVMRRSRSMPSSIRPCWPPPVRAASAARRRRPTAGWPGLLGRRPHARSPHARQVQSTCPHRHRSTPAAASSSTRASAASSSATDVGNVCRAARGESAAGRAGRSGRRRSCASSSVRCRPGRAAPRSRARGPPRGAACRRRARSGPASECAARAASSSARSRAPRADPVARCSWPLREHRQHQRDPAEHDVVAVFALITHADAVVRPGEAQPSGARRRPPGLRLPGRAARAGLTTTAEADRVRSTAGARQRVCDHDAPSRRSHCPSSPVACAFCASTPSRSARTRASDARAMFRSSTAMSPALNRRSAAEWRRVARACASFRRRIRAFAWTSR